MKRTVWMLLVGLLLPGAVAAQVPIRPNRRNLQEANAQRAALETQIMHRFVNRSGNQLGLDTSTRGQLERILRESSDQRRELTRRAGELRGALLAALRDPNTPDERFTEILRNLDDLRSQESKQWQQDQKALGKVLTPRQRAQFVLLWLRFQETIRDVISRRGGPDSTGGRLPLPPGY